MRHVFPAALLAVALGAAGARAALTTNSMDAVREEVSARAAALTGNLDAAQKKLKKVYTAVLKELDRRSASRSTDAGRIRSIVRSLDRALPGDTEMQNLLAQGVDGFLGELRTDLTRTQRHVGLMDDANRRKPGASKACDKARASIDEVAAAAGPAERVRSLQAAVRRLDEMGKAAVKAAKLNAPVDVHRFELDLVTGQYVVKGELISREQVDRDLVGSLCSKCHAEATDELKASVHFTIAAKSERVLFPGGGAHGMLDRACGLPSTTGLTNYTSDINLGECSKCHVGRYLPVMEGFFTASFTQMGVAKPAEEAKKLVDGGLDCLICHSSSYRSHPDDGKLAAVAGTSAALGESPNAVGSARDARDNADFDRDGKPDLVIDMNGDGTPDAPLMMDTNGDGTPDTPWPTVAQDRGIDALRSIGPTTEEACLRCHEHARTGYKRGTLFAQGHDVHATATHGVFDGAKNQCTACHTADHHKFIRGHAVGGDLAAADYPAPKPGTAPNPADPTDLACTKCHDVAGLPATIHTSRHLAAMACETCHIPYGSGITYSLFGQGGQVSFGRNEAGKDTKLVVSDMYVTGDKADLDADFLAYRTRPIFMWFDGGTSFLAQSLAVRGMPNAKITPFKPMANGMAFDGRFFSGATAKNAVGADYNAYSMYRFFANGNNAEAFAGLGMLEMTPDRVRSVTMADFMDKDPEVQTMALMLIFPNLVYFDKAAYGYEHYLTRSGSPYDLNHDGIIDAGQPFNFDLYGAANAGLRQFQGFNGPMGFPASYEWYPRYDDPSDVISMKLPDGSEIKMFLKMQAAGLPADQQAAFLGAVENYPSFSNVTLGGHGVVAKKQALGATSCLDCHGSDGALAHKVPVGRRVPTDLGPMGVVDLPLYQWRYYDVRKLVDLGLATASEAIVAGTADVDIDGDTNYVRESANTFIVNWFMPSMPGAYRKSDDASALAGSGLSQSDLTTHGGRWMPVLEPVTDLVPNYKVLGYSDAELLWL